MPDTLAARTEAGSAVAPSVLRLPMAPEHVTVLGYRVKASDARWTGLYLDLALVREKSSLFVCLIGHEAAPLDPHLDCPWQHPDDRALYGADTDDCRYRVRSRYEPGRRYRFTIDGRARVRKVQSVAFERHGDAWWIVLRLDP